MLKTTLIPLNTKEPDQQINDLAEFIAHFGTETAYLLHVTGGKRKDETKRAETTLQRKAVFFQNRGISTEVLIRQGAVAETICRTAAALAVDFISVLWKKKNVIKRTILNSPDIDLLRICSYPTLIYKNNLLSGGSSRLDTIVYATDCRLADSRVLPYLQSAPFRAKTFYLLHVRERAPDPETEKKRHQAMMGKLDRLMNRCLGHFEKIEKLLLTGSVRSTIVGESRRRDADLLVIGRNEKVKPLDNLLGSTAEALTHQTHCAILIIA
jgi:nucleotide-binding universal stress UspA family protein